MKDTFRIHHWEFFINGPDGIYVIYVCELRSNDVIGYINDITLPEIEAILMNEDEQTVYEWIENNIEYM